MIDGLLESGDRGTAREFLLTFVPLFSVSAKLAISSGRPKSVEAMDSVALSSRLSVSVSINSYADSPSIPSSEGASLRDDIVAVELFSTQKLIRRSTAGAGNLRECEESLRVGVEGCEVKSGNLDVSIVSLAMCSYFQDR